MTDLNTPEMRERVARAMYSAVAVYGSLSLLRAIWPNGRYERTFVVDQAAEAAIREIAAQQGEG